MSVRKPSRRNRKKKTPQMIKQILAMKPMISIDNNNPNPAITKAITRKTPAIYKKLLAESKSLGSLIFALFFAKEFLK